MSALGQKRTCAAHKPMSALGQKQTFANDLCEKKGVSGNILSAAFIAPYDYGPPSCWGCEQSERGKCQFSPFLQW